MTSKTGPCRALIAKGFMGVCVVLSTDNSTLANEMEMVSEFVGDAIGDDFVPEEPGLYLFEGEGTWTDISGYEGPAEYEIVWEGKVRRVTADEYEGLLAMTPPEPEDAV